MKSYVKKVQGGRYIPTDSDINKLLGVCSTITEDKEKLSNCIAAIEAIERDFKDYKENKIKLDDKGELDVSDWNNKTEEEKKTAYLELYSICEKFTRLTNTGLCAGIIFFGLITAIFIGSIVDYCLLHKHFRQKEKISNQTIQDINEALTIMQKHIAFKEEGDKKTFKEAADNLKGILNEKPWVSFELNKAIGALEGGIELEKVNQDTFNTIKNTLDAEIAGLSARYFWTSTPKKWAEIAFRSFWGVIVGILFYIAGLLELGTFHKEKIVMMITEIVITPIVVIAILFLIPIGGLINVVPSESSIYVTLGIAFVLGFSIRRTVGLLDYIKKRIFPEPKPSAPSSR